MDGKFQIRAVYEAGNGREEVEAMRKGKQKSIDTLMGALAEAESRAFYEEEDNVLNDLDELLNVF